MTTAIASNSPAMVELLLKSKKLNLHAKTKNRGKSLMHLCVGPYGNVSKSKLVTHCIYT